jgi:hypothetical protein
MTNRRQFLHRTATQVAALSALPMSGGSRATIPTSASEEWDFSWATRLTAKHRAVFDVVDVDGGIGVFRAATWGAQCVNILGAAPTDVAPVIVLRAHAVALALSQPFWDERSVGRTLGVTLPLSTKGTTHNPVLMSERDGLPPQFVNGLLPAQLARGATVLACNLALQSWIDAVRVQDKRSPADARTLVLAALVPGVILQPSGVLAATIAQEHGCSYLRPA